MRILILLLVLPALLALCAVTLYAIPLPVRWSASRDLIAAVGAGLLGAGYLAGLLVYLLVFLRRASRTLDPALLPLGLVARPEFPVGRRYSGAIDEHTVQVTYRPAYALQPANLDVTVFAQLGQQLAATAGPQRPLLDCRNCPRIEFPDLPGMQLYAADESRARALLAHPGVQSALIRLLDAPNASGTRELYVQPDRICFRARLRMSAEQTVGWLNDVLPALLAIAETPIDVPFGE
jgi:hypothetical protein